MDEINNPVYDEKNDDLEDDKFAESTPMLNDHANNRNEQSTTK